MSMDVMVIGGGPSGLAVCAALAERGLSVGCLAPEHPAPWPNNYGVWEDEIAHLGLSEAYERVWERPVVYPTSEARELERRYARLNNEALRGRFIEVCEAGGVSWLEGRASGFEALRGETRVDTEDGRGLRARVVIDATGHRPALVQRAEDRSPGYQAAYGVVGRFDGDPLEGRELVLMDFRTDYDEAADEVDEASFLYGMRLGGGRVFLEETTLVSRPAVGFDVLEERLNRRLEARGVRCEEVYEVERCLIPMGVGMPDLEQRVVGFGGAAAMVHPATGYQIGRMLGRAPKLAESVAMGLEEGVGADALARRAWRVVWSEDEERARAFYNFGMESLLGLSPEQTRGFFESFFGLPDEKWKGYMSGTLPAAAIPGVMWRVFLGVGGPLRLSLARAAMLPEGRSMVRAWWSAAGVG